MDERRRHHHAHKHGMMLQALRKCSRSHLHPSNGMATMWHRNTSMPMAKGAKTCSAVTQSIRTCSIFMRLALAVSM